jgi:hypothetical protein
MMSSKALHLTVGIVSEILNPKFNISFATPMSGMTVCKAVLRLTNSDSVVDSEISVCNFDCHVMGQPA